VANFQTSQSSGGLPNVKPQKILKVLFSAHLYQKLLLDGSSLLLVGVEMNPSTSASVLMDF
jgi:hypothetical protein